AVASLGYCNPFLPERIELEQAALGREFVPEGVIWSASVTDPDAERANVTLLHRKLDGAIDSMRAKIAEGVDVQPEEWAIYEDSVHYLLYQRYYLQFVAAEGKWRFYRDFLSDWNQLFEVPGKQFHSALAPAHAFACFRQIQRAFHHVYDNIIGNS